MGSGLIPRLELDSFPAFIRQREVSPAVQVARYFRKLLSKQLAERPQPVTLPPITLLSFFFHCMEDDILKALEELSQWGYRYSLHGKDSLIRLTI